MLHDIAVAGSRNRRPICCWWFNCGNPARLIYPFLPSSSRYWCVALNPGSRGAVSLSLLSFQTHHNGCRCFFVFLFFASYVLLTLLQRETSASLVTTPLAPYGLA